MNKLWAWQEHQLAGRPGMRSPVIAPPSEPAHRSAQASDSTSAVELTGDQYRQHVCSWFDQHACRSQIGADRGYERGERTGTGSASGGPAGRRWMTHREVLALGVGEASTADRCHLATAAREEEKTDRTCKGFSWFLNIFFFAELGYWILDSW